MTTFLVFAILGLGAGVAYLALAFGVVVIYKGSGVLNFGHGAIAMFAAYLYADLSGTDPGQAGLSPWVALVVVMAGGALFGVLVYFLVMRQLRGMPVLAKVVATLGLLSLLQGIAFLHWGVFYAHTVPSLFPKGAVSIGGGAKVGGDRLYGLGLAVLVTAGLWWLYGRTRFGRATRAVAENEKGASLLGYSPDFVASLNWALGCALAALAGAIIAPVGGLDSTRLPLMILPAFAAALLGRFRSFSVAAVVAIGIGIAQSELANYWGNQPGVQDAVPVLVVILAMIVSGRLIPQRGTLSEGRPPKTPAGRLGVVPVSAGVGLAVALLLFGDKAYQAAMGTSTAYAILALSLVVIAGYMGQISIAQLTFAGLAGLFLSKVTLNFGVPFPLSILIAALLAIPIGVLVGLPALRVRGINLAVVTFGLAYSVTAVVFNNANWTSVGGVPVPGTAPVPSPSVAGYSFDAFDHPRRFGFFALTVLIVTVVLVSNLRRSSTGRKMLAVRSNERAAAAAGIAVSRIKLQAFALSSFIAGLGGAVLATQSNQATFDQFTAGGSIALITLAYIGGIASIAGALVAGAAALGGVLSLVLDHIPRYNDYYLPVTGVLLILTVLAQPDGAAPLVQEHLRAAKSRLRRRRAPRTSANEPETGVR